MDIEDNKPSKPTLPKPPQYRYPKGHPSGKGGKFMKPEVAEKIMSEGGTVTVSPSTGAVSAEGVAKFNDEMKKYINNLAQQSFQAGFSSSFGKDEKDSSESEFSKLFETISNKVINKIGNVNSNILELKKQNSEQAVKLLNLTTSMYSTISSQKDTVDELYKIIDTKLSQLIGKIDKNNEPAKQTSENDSPIRAMGIIRGIAGLNKQITELHKTVTSKVVPLLSAIADKISTQAQLAKVEAETPKADVLKPETEVVQAPASNTVSIVKKDQSRAESASRVETLGTGLAQIVGGAATMAGGGFLESILQKIDDLPSKLMDMGKESAKQIEIPLAQGATLGDLSKQFDLWKKESFGDRDFTQDISNLMEPLWEGLKENVAERIGKDQAWMTELFSKYDSEVKTFQGVVKSVTDGIDAVIEQVTDWGNYFKKSPKVTDDKGIAPKNLDGTPSQKMDSNSEPLTNKLSKPIEQQDTEIRGIHALDMYKKQPIGELSIVNTATNPLQSISGNVVQQPISPMTQAIQQSSSEIEMAKRNGLIDALKQQTQMILINNKESNTKQQPPTIINPPSPRNTDSTKAILDKMALMGGYTGSGFILN